MTDSETFQMQELKSPDVFHSTCPKCGYTLYCGCSACLPNLPTGMKPYRWTKDGEAIICPACGFTASADWWLDEDWRQAGLWATSHRREGS